MPPRSVSRRTPSSPPGEPPWAGVPTGTVAWLAVVLSPAVPIVSTVAVTSEPGGCPGAPALTVVLLLATAVLVIAFT